MSRVDAELELICEVCEKNKAIGVANCTLAQPCSHAYCRECLREHADPIWCFLAVLDVVGPEHVALWVKSINSYKDGVYINFEAVLKIHKDTADQEYIEP